MARSRLSKKPAGFLVQKPLGQFTDRVQAVGPEQFGVVSIDCAKGRSKFFLCNFYGKVLIEPTPVEHTQNELHAACDRVRSAMDVHGLPHPACQPRHSICDKLLAFHCERKTDIQRALEDIDRLSAQLSGRTRQEETQMLQNQLDNPSCRRRRGPQALGKIIPLVLARLGIRMLQSETEGEDPN
jgi:hypothetical protein